MNLVLQQLRSRKLHAEFSKCIFCLEGVVSLGQIVEKKDVMVDLEEVKAMVE